MIVFARLVINSTVALAVAEQLDTRLVSRG